MTSEHLVNIFPKPAPETVRPHHLEQAGEWLDLWRRHIGDPNRSPHGDYEDFFEQAARLDAALSAFGPENTWIRVMTGDQAASAVNAGTGESRPVVDLAHLPKYGCQAGGIHNPYRLEQERRADRYHVLRAFQERAGRRLAVGGFATGGPRDAVRLIKQMLESGVHDFFIKGFPAKTGIWEFSLKPGDGRRQIMDALMRDDSGWTLVRLEGLFDALLIQEHLHMSHEYRLFIVDGVPVTGAAAITEFTPLDNTGQAFDDRFRTDRRTAEQPVSDPQLLERMHAFASDAAEDFVTEGLYTYVLDVALDADGEPLIVELNGQLNSGLFASDPSRVTAAMARARQLAAD